MNFVNPNLMENYPVTIVEKALKPFLRFVRRNQRVEIKIKLKGTFVLVSKQHKYSLFNTRHQSEKRTVCLFTDLALAGSDQLGFDYVKEPDGTELRGTSLRQFLSFEVGKAWFKKDYDFDARSEKSFEFKTSGWYRLNDRLIWTVQDFSDDFQVTIRLDGFSKEKVTLKIHHHNEVDIMAHINDHQPDIISLDFGSEILPYQGFEIMWRLEETEC